MFRKYVAVIAIVLSSLSLGLMHGNTAIAKELLHTKAGISSQGTGCQPVSQGVLNKQTNKLHTLKKAERDPIPPDAQLSCLNIIYLTTSLVTDSQIWKLASWTPPDKLVLTNAYSTSL